MQQPKVFWWFVGTAGGILLLFVVLWGLIGWRYAGGRPTPTAAPLEAWLEAAGDDGTPGVLPALDVARRAVPDDVNNALQVWPGLLAGTLDEFEAGEVVRAEAWLADPKHVERLGALVELVLAAPRGGDLLGGDGTASVADRVLERQRHGRLRRVAYLIRAAAIHALRRGDAAAAERAAIALPRLQQFADEAPSLIGWNTRGALESVTVDLLDDGLAARVWDAAAVERIEQAFVASLSPRAALAKHLAGERLLLEDLLGRAFTDDGFGGGRVTPRAAQFFGTLRSRDLLDTLWEGTEQRTGKKNPPLWDLALGPLMLRGSPSRAEVREDMADALAALEELVTQDRGAPGWAEALGFFETNTVDPSAGRRAIARGGLDWLSSIANDWKVCAHLGLWFEARHLATRLALSAERFRLAHGRFPATVAELRAGGFPEAADRGPAGPFRFAVRGEGEAARLVVYADGADGDDDGGRAIDAERWPYGFPPLASSPPPPPDGDVVLFGGG